MGITNRVPELAAARFGSEDSINLTRIQADTGIAYSTVSRWVKGQIDRVDFDTLAAWCKYFGVSAGEILTYTPDGE